MQLAKQMLLVEVQIVESVFYRLSRRRKQSTWGSMHLIPTLIIKVGRTTPIYHGETVETISKSHTTIKVSKVKVQGNKSRVVVRRVWKMCLVISKPSRKRPTKREMWQ